MVPRQKILGDPDACAGCRICMLTCSAKHENVFHPSRARLQVVKFDSEFLDVPVTCSQCDDCIEACEELGSDCIYEDSLTGAIVVQPDDCIGCFACVDACSSGMIVLHDDLAVKCDLCGEDEPECIATCPFDALKLVPISEKVNALEERAGNILKEFMT